MGWDAWDKTVVGDTMYFGYDRRIIKKKYKA